MPKTFEISIQGQVQGVGFRPFVYLEARKLGLHGIVYNDTDGVKIRINSSQSDAEILLERIRLNPPISSKIMDFQIREIKNEEFDKFEIVQSIGEGPVNLPLTPDFAICDSCKQEVSDPSNRRYFYPFTTCTNCGPRYAITTSYPFERENTSMSSFTMCNKCEEEYKDPEDPRFHSQTNSCPTCGVSIWLTDQNGLQLEKDAMNVILKISQLIKEGCIIAIKNSNGYLLCCDATNAPVIQELRQRKNRPTKPLAVLYPSLEEVEREFNVSPKEKNELESAVSPIVILDASSYNGNLAENAIAPKLGQIGVILPSTALLFLLIKQVGIPLVATSGNIHGSPIISSENQAMAKLSAVADYFLHHDLDIVTPQDDSVIKFSASGQQRIIIRGSRGLAPNFWGRNVQNESVILAMGAHLKNTVAFTPNSNIYLSQYIGNLDHYEVYERLEKCIEDYINLFHTIPNTILVDSHDQYQSTILGNLLSDRWNANIVKVQHHKAHFASVLGEHNQFGSEEKILGVIWDGTGLGDDGNIWGGEFLVYDKHVISREIHFDYFDWLANDKMSREPRLPLFSLLNNKYRDVIKDKFTDTEWALYHQLLERNTLKTSSVGRLFDAVASALGLCDFNSFEGEAAMILESRAIKSNNKNPRHYLQNKKYQNIPSQIIVLECLLEINEGIAVEDVAQNFLFTLANTVVDIAKRLKINIIALSGGVFQNGILLDFIVHLTQNKFKLLRNMDVSPNDENIALGQVFYHRNIKE